MDQTALSAASAESEFNLPGFLRQVWRSKVLVGCLMAICAIVGLAIGILLPRQYEASAMISPVLDEAGSGRLGGLGALASQYGGLASLAGINLPGKGRKDEALAVLQSQLLTQAYIRDNDLVPVLFRKDWDTAAGRWKGRPPTLWKANQFFKKDIRQVTEDRKSGLVMLTIKWTDPKLAAKWANDLVKMANDYLRTKAIDESERNIRYLNEQATKTNVVEVQKAIYSLLQDEINKEMIAKGRDEYALRVVDPAFVPEKSATPGPLALTCGGALLGIVISVIVLLARRKDLR